MLTIEAIIITLNHCCLLQIQIVVVGVGGGGVNAVNGMIATATRLKDAGVKFIAMNTDQQALSNSRADIRLPLGPRRTKGLGTGGIPEVGFQAAEESKLEIMRWVM